MRLLKRKAKEYKTSALEAADRARRNAKGRLKTEYALLLESPSANRAANREVGTELRSYAKCVLKHSDSCRERYRSAETFRDEKLMRVDIPALCDAIELPCFRVSPLDVATLKLCFPILREIRGLAEFLKTFMNNLGNPFAIVQKPDYAKDQYYYLTRWLKEE